MDPREQPGAALGVGLFLRVLRLRADRSHWGAQLVRRVADQVCARPLRELERALALVAVDHRRALAAFLTARGVDPHHGQRRVLHRDHQIEAADAIEVRDLHAVGLAADRQVDRRMKRPAPRAQQHRGIGLPILRCDDVGDAVAVEIARGDLPRRAADFVLRQRQREQALGGGAGTCPRQCSRSRGTISP